MDNTDPNNIKALVSAPSAPGKPSGTPGSGQVSLVWTTPTDTGGSVISDYIIQRKINGQPNESFVNVTDEISYATSTIVTGLTNGVSYIFRVRAVNISGLLSVFSENSEPITPRTIPSAPIWFANSSFNNYIDLMWTSPQNGGSPITDYIIQRKVASEPNSAYVTLNEGVSTSTRLTVTGLTKGTSYTFRVAAVNAAGIGPYSTATTPVLFASVPAKPLQPTITRGNSQLSLSWIAPDNGGSPITDYIIQRKIDRSDDSTYVTVNDGVSASTSYINTGLTNGTLYVFRIAAVNSKGQSEFSLPSIPIKPATLPDAPTGLSAIPNVGAPWSSDGTITLNWNLPYNGGAAITDYVIVGKKASQSDSSYAVISDTVSSLNRSIVTMIPPGPFIFKVAAVNARGTGLYSSPSNVVNSIPTQPTNVVATPTGNGQITVSWTTPNNGGSPIIDYSIQYKLYNNPASSWTTHNDGVSTNNTAVINNLNFSYYIFKVAARNSIGLSAYSNDSQPARPFRLFNKNSWANIGAPWRDFLDEAADRWARFIMINPGIMNAIVSQYDPGWEGIQLNSQPNSFEVLNIGISNNTLPYYAQTFEVLPLSTGGINLTTFDFKLNVNGWWQNRTVTFNNGSTFFMADEDWRSTIFHELGHALGIGSFWTTNDGQIHQEESFYFLNGNEFINTQRAYNNIAGVSEILTPVEAQGGLGTAGAHWENDFRARPAPFAGGSPGIINDLMSQARFVQNGNITTRMPRVLSSLTINNLVDYGYMEVRPGANEGTPQINTGVVRILTQEELGFIESGCSCNCCLPITKITPPE